MTAVLVVVSDRLSVTWALTILRVVRLIDFTGQLKFCNWLVTAWLALIVQHRQTIDHSVFSAHSLTAIYFLALFRHPQRADQCCPSKNQCRWVMPCSEKSIKKMLSSLAETLHLTITNFTLHFQYAFIDHHPRSLSLPFTSLTVYHIYCGTRMHSVQ